MESGDQHTQLGIFTAGKLVSARGTEDGLVLRLDGKAKWDTVLSEVECFLNERKKFVEGAEVCLEWLDRLPSRDQSTELEALLKSRFNLSIGRRKPTKAPSPVVEPAGPLKAQVEKVTNLPLETDAENYLSKVADILGPEILADDELNARLIFGTVRSGQRIETPSSLVVVGDVNPGADIVAGGDVIVLGSLRGTAHACAYDDEFQDGAIIALHMRPIQLRIGSVISRGSDDAIATAEIAHIEDRRIVVEPFDVRLLKNRKGGC